MAIVKLTARKDFKEGETGYATGNSVGSAHDGFVPADGKLVRAVEDVRSGTIGSFKEIEKAE